MLTASILASAALAVRAAGRDTDQGTVKADRQTFKWTNADASTDSRDFSNIPGLSDVAILKSGGVTATVSGVIEGAPVDLRIRDESDGRTLRPGRVRFDPTKGSNIVSFTFVRNERRRPGCSKYNVQWRSPSEREALFKAGDLVLTYDFDRTTDEGIRLACPD